MTPATATRVSTYGSASNSVETDVEYSWRKSESALEKPKRRQAIAAPNGRQLPKISAASAMNPRPAVMLSSKEFTNPSERYAPPAAASMPDTVTAP